ncbi:myo-inosose-2 dehydratase [Paenibacillus sp. GCM10027628]|uniref:myo-inosose-2 dehydratase n=1 Tax=Paenibacillus sp. GCM10027628 TaxID=3273413 RepID=UPI003643E0E5
MFRKDKIKLGIAPIAWTNDDLPELGRENSFEQCISEMALAGFAGSEVGNKYPRDPVTLQHVLAVRNLEIASAWFSSYLTTKPLQETVDAFVQHRDFLYEMGAKVIVVSEQGHSIQGLDIPLFANKPVFSDNDWQTLASGLNRLGELAKDKNMTVVYHHHMGTGVQTAVEIDKLMAMTDPDRVSLLYDTGHLVFSGENPYEVLETYLPRIKHVHLKDIRGEAVDKVKADQLSFLQAVREGAFTVPGDGIIDFVPIFAKLAEYEYEGWFVVEAEQDPAKANPFEYALKARRYIKEKTGL